MSDDAFIVTPLREELERHIAKLNKVARSKLGRQRVSRLAELNVRSTGGTRRGRLTALEELERQFLALTVPHVVRRAEFTGLLSLLTKLENRKKRK